MTQGIKDKVVVTTGASSGLGEATARHLAAQGASVVLGARRVDRLRSLADELTASGGKALAVATDVTQFDQVKRLVDTAVQAYGRIDVMINNAGLMTRAQGMMWYSATPAASFLRGLSRCVGPCLSLGLPCEYLFERRKKSRWDTSFWPSHWRWPLITPLAAPTTARAAGPRRSRRLKPPPRGQTV